jgi:DNA-binding transcriptional regulator YdaS (Cro superfamily)
VVKDQALARALAARGNSSRVAEALGITTAAIAQWTTCPAEHAKIVEAVTGVPRHELRPDLWEAFLAVDHAEPSAGGETPTQPAGKSPARIALEEAQAILRRYVDPSDSLSEELIRDRRAAAARGD